MRAFFKRASSRLSLVFVIGLAISIASFVDSLKMGRDALDFLFKQLSQIHGFHDIAMFVAAIVHGLLEWWRSVVSTLLEIVRIHIPKWMHQPLSVTFFIMSRAINQGLRAFSNTEADYRLIGKSGRRPEVGSPETYKDDYYGRP